MKAERIKRYEAATVLEIEITRSWTMATLQQS